MFGTTTGVGAACEPEKQNITEKTEKIMRVEGLWETKECPGKMGKYGKK